MGVEGLLSERFPFPVALRENRLASESTRQHTDAHIYTSPWQLSCSFPRETQAEPSTGLVSLCGKQRKAPFGNSPGNLSSPCLMNRSQKQLGGVSYHLSPPKGERSGSGTSEPGRNELEA